MAVETNKIGMRIVFIKFPINVIKNNKMGCSILAEAILPVVKIKVIKIGTNKFASCTNWLTESFTIVIISAKLLIIKVAINIYCT